MPSINKNKCFLIFLGILLSNFILAQKLDSLYLVLIESKEDTNKVMVLNSLSVKLQYSDPKKSIDFISEALFLSEYLSYKKGLAQAYLNKGNYHIRKSDYNTALTANASALTLSREINDKSIEASAYAGMGAAYSYKGEYKEAVENYFKALKLKEDLNDFEGESVVCNNLGELYLFQMQYGKALKYHYKSLFNEKLHNRKKGIAEAYSHIANVYNAQKNQYKAHLYYNLALKIYQTLNDKMAKAQTRNNLGIIEEDQGYYLFALNNRLAALDLFEEIGNKNEMAITCVAIAKIYKINYDYQKSISYAGRAIDLALETDSKRVLREAYDVIAEVYERDKEYTKALDHFHKAAELKNILFNEATTKQIFEMEAKYESQKNKREIQLLSKENKIQDLELGKNRLIIYSTGIVILLLAFLAFTMYRRYQLKQKANKLITEQKLIVEEKQKEILDSISYAKRLQNAILPAENFWKENLPDSFVYYRSKDIVAGDFYWLERFPPGSNMNEGLILFAAADCTGHGVPGALVSVVCSNALNRSLLEFGITDPGKILDKTRDLVIATFEKSGEEVRDGMDISLCSFNKTTNELCWAGANNPLWVISPSENGPPKMQEFIADKQPVGKHERQRPFTSHKLQLQKGDLIYVFTDGYADQFGGPRGKKFKSAHLKEMILSVCELSLDEQKQKLDKAFEDWKGCLEQVDDVCFIAVKV